MFNPIEILFIANCGLLIKSQQAKVLVDGIYLLESNAGVKKINHDLFQHEDLFNPIPSEILDRIVNGIEEFQDIDSLLFTHGHRDHFSAKKTRECLEKNSIGSIFLPNGADPEVVAVRELAKKSEMRLFDMNLPFGVKEEQIVNDISIQYFRTGHSDKKYSSVEHYGFLISIDDKKIYVSGDADYTNDYQRKMLEGEDVTIGFFNPLYFNKRIGRDLINDINPKRVIMYHVPFEKDDKYGLRKMSQKNIGRFSGGLPPCDIVSGALQTFLI